LCFNIAETPCAFGIDLNYPVNFIFREIRPESLCNIKFRIRDLPEQKIADPHLAGCPYEQIGIMPAGGVKVVTDTVLVDLVESYPAVFIFLCYFFAASMISVRAP